MLSQAGEQKATLNIVRHGTTTTQSALEDELYFLIGLGKKNIVTSAICAKSRFIQPACWCTKLKGGKKLYLWRKLRIQITKHKTMVKL